MLSASENPQKRIRVVVSAGSQLAANQLAADLATDPSLDVGFATHVPQLWHEIDTNRPAVVLLDTRLAGERTPQLVRELAHHKLAVLVRSEIDNTSPDMLLNCVAAGALAVLPKPTAADQLAASIPSLIWNIRAASKAKIENLPALVTSEPLSGAELNTRSILVIGGGMGSSIAIANLLSQLPAAGPAAVVVTPLPPKMIGPWIARLRKRAAMKIAPAENGRPLHAGTVFVAPGDAHLLLQKANSDWIIQIKDGPAVFYQKPSMEVLLNSIADAPAPNAIGVLLAGAGVDGIAGLLRLRKAGGQTLTESPQLSLFTDLPTRALQCRAAGSSGSLNELPGKIIELARSQTLPQAA
jgi:two-component system, chemotaxis family, protein-glutamate methylesterase/glutaminase